MVVENSVTTIELYQSRIVLRDDLLFVPQRYHDTTCYHIESPRDGKFYRVGYEEYVFISLLDGSTTFAEAVSLTAQQLGAASLSTSQAMTTYLWLLEKKLGSIQQQQREPTTARNPSTPSWLSRLNPFWTKIPLGRPDVILQRLTPFLGWIFSPAAMFVNTIIGLSAVAVIFVQWPRFAAASASVFDASNWLWLGLIWVGLKLIHELAHGIACRRYGGEVREVGLVFILFAPLAYIDVTSAWRLPSKWRRIQIAAAGMYVELVIAAAATLIWLQIDSALITHLLFNLIIMSSVSTLVFNANPLMRFDGYFILSDLLEIPNLYEQGAQAVGRHLRWLFLGQTTGSPISIGTQAVLIGVYGWLAAIWRLLICLSLALVASVLFKGAGIALAVLGVASWYGPPCWRLAKLLRHEFEIERGTFFRFVAATSVATTLAIAALWHLPAPVPVTVPGVVEYRDVVHLRTLVPGFVQKVLVRDGQYVERGDLLFVLKNDDATNVYRDLQLAIQQAKIRQRMAIEAQDAARADVEEQNWIALDEQLQEANRRYAALHVRAPVSGKVVRRSLANLLGTYVRESDVLLSIGNEQDKEFLISVAQQDCDALVPAVGAPVWIRGASQPAVSGKLVRLEPRASTEMPHAALAATSGGPLSVVSAEQEAESQQPAIVLAEPRFRGVATVATRDASQLWSGQRGRLSVGIRRRRLGTWLWQVAHEWIDAPQYSTVSSRS